MAHLWSGRFAGDPDAELFAFGSSFRFDRRLFEDDVRGSRRVGGGARARRRAVGGRRRGDRRRPAQILAARAGRSRLRQRTAHGDEDVHAFVERELVARIGDAGRRLHTGPLAQRAGRGRSAALPEAPHPDDPAGDRRHRARRFVDLAERAGDALMPSYTHLRRAQPVLVAHFLLSHCAALRRDVDRLDAVLNEADELPLGSGAIAGTSYADRRRRRSPPRSASRASRATASTSAAIATSSPSFLHAASLGMVHLSRIAEDFILFTSEEFGFFELADARRDRQQPDAAEEEPRSAGAGARQERPRDRPPHRAGWSR